MSLVHAGDGAGDGDREGDTGGEEDGDPVGDGATDVGPAVAPGVDVADGEGVGPGDCGSPPQPASARASASASNAGAAPRHEGRHGDIRIRRRLVGIFISTARMGPRATRSRGPRVPPIVPQAWDGRAVRVVRRGRDRDIVIGGSSRTWRRGGDSNPRRTERPLTVFETAGSFLKVPAYAAFVNAARSLGLRYGQRSTFTPREMAQDGSWLQMAQAFLGPSGGPPRLCRRGPSGRRSAPPSRPSWSALDVG